MKKKNMHPTLVSLLRRHDSRTMDHLTLLILNGWFRRFWLRWATIQAHTWQGDVGSLLPVQNGYAVQTGEMLNLPPACHSETVNRDAVLIQKGGLAVETNPPSAISAKGSGIMPKTSI